jgi:hypothetical protein
MPDLVARKTASGCGFKRLRLPLSGPQETLPSRQGVTAPVPVNSGRFV